ncbi:hypothetical protein GCM10010869_53420 [Mesorhizobium tianshanense]|uniref:Uncharacterized protein n=1 Tax=Mesorhizobium tianshanense TaxID=39844 RepID=A0A562N7D7_9HYPH|nr:hypothetical protein [Mesorhizobium tianshanense]TWI27998.1 hypothetical protein IQ26_05473 [Mesorhizobium tianshanense]GLS39745.1 hypothetical protein GCM10010869_53420 [Mesorhizobium tianshanense]
MARDILIGDEITLTATILKILPDGLASVSIPTYNFPYSIDAPKKAKPGIKVELIGYATRVDDEDGKVTVKIGDLVTVDQDSITNWKRERTVLRDRAD